MSALTPCLMRPGFCVCASTKAFLPLLPVLPLTTLSLLRELCNSRKGTDSTPNLAFFPFCTTTMGIGLGAGPWGEIRGNRRGGAIMTLFGDCRSLGMVVPQRNGDDFAHPDFIQDIIPRYNRGLCSFR